MWGLIFATVLSLADAAPPERAQVTYAFSEVDRTVSLDDVINHFFLSLDKIIEQRGGVRGLVADRFIFGYGGDRVEELDLVNLVLRLERILEQGEAFDDTHYTIAKGAWLGLSFGGPEHFYQELSDEDLKEACDAIFLPPVRN